MIDSDTTKVTKNDTKEILRVDFCFTVKVFPFRFLSTNEICFTNRRETFFKTDALIGKERPKYYFKVKEKFLF